MAIKKKSWEVLIPAEIDEVWGFFSNPKNLNEITPTDMKFSITSDPQEKCYPGQIITYKVSPFPFYTTDWVTEITEVEDEKYFIDEQRFGPFKFWHHQHHFEVVENGVLMTDILHYGLPMGKLGELFASGIVNNRIEKIFQFREEVINKKWA